MSDNTQVNSGTGDVVRDIDRTGQPGSQAAKTQVMQLDVGGQYAESLVNPFNPVPTDDANLNSAQSQDQPLFVALTGDPSGDWAGVNLLEQVMDPATGVNLSVNVVNPPKLDANGALVLSDAPAQIRLVGAAAQFLYIDTTGYQSVQISIPTVGGFNVSVVTSSNDGITFAQVLGYLVGASSAAPVNAMSAGSSYVFPVTGRIIRLQISSSGSAVAYLRNIPAPNPSVIMPQNIAQVGGSTVISGGSTGLMGVGGPQAAGVLAASVPQNPIIIGSVDSGTPGVIPTNGSSANRGAPAVRALLVDNTGRLRLAEETGVVNNLNVPSLAVQEVGQVEGQSRDELLAQILLELRINNELMAGLPRQLYAALQSLQLAPTTQNQFTGFASDEPASFRSDPTIFN